MGYSYYLYFICIIWWIFNKLYSIGDKVNINKRDILKVLLSFIIFFYIGSIAVLICRGFLNIDFKNHPIYILVLEAIVELIIGVIAFFLYKDLFKKSIKKIKENRLNLKKIGEVLILGYVTVMGCNFLVTTCGLVIGNLFGIESLKSDNQLLIENLRNLSPFLMFISACILAPVVEETIFRGGIGKVIKNKKVFITVSGLIFGLMHVTESMTLLLEILFIGIIVSYILNSDKYSDKRKVILSFTSIIGILIIGFIIFYIEYGNILSVIKILDPSEIIASFSYIGMGIGLASIYANKGDLLRNIGIHATVNTIALILLFFK